MTAFNGTIKITRLSIWGIINEKIEVVEDTRRVEEDSKSNEADDLIFIFKCDSHLSPRAISY